MSEIKDTAAADAEVVHNVYFDGKVKSLWLDTDKGRATVGVMKKGAYQFSTSSIETIVVISGIMKTKFVGEDWVTHQLNESFEVAANVVFDVIGETDIAYICYYR